MTITIPISGTPRLTLTDERLPQFARHLVRNERATTSTLIELITQPDTFQAEFLAFLCGINTGDWRPFDTWGDFLERNLRWREVRETGIDILEPQLVADLTHVPEDERPEHLAIERFTVPAHDKQLCPDAFGRWSIQATAYREERFGRPCVIWEVEPSF